MSYLFVKEFETFFVVSVDSQDLEKLFHILMKQNVLQFFCGTEWINVVHFFNPFDIFSIPSKFVVLFLFFNSKYTIKLFLWLLWLLWWNHVRILYIGRKLFTLIHFVNSFTILTIIWSSAVWQTLVVVKLIFVFCNLLCRMSIEWSQLQSIHVGLMFLKLHESI